MKLFFVVLGESSEHAVKDVVISLVFILSYNSGFLQKILVNSCSLNTPLFVKIDFNELSESAGIVISDSLGISKC